MTQEESKMSELLKECYDVLTRHGITGDLPYRLKQYKHLPSLSEEISRLRTELIKANLQALGHSEQEAVGNCPICEDNSKAVTIKKYYCYRCENEYYSKTPTQEKK